MTKGTGAVVGSIALVEQTPWVMSGTLRKNILFGRDYDEEFYNKVVFACALSEDIANWKDGDRTRIGEHGMNVSGGQKARIALARAVYSRADIYILDDPLSAVDPHVMRHLLNHREIGKFRGYTSLEREKLVEDNALVPEKNWPSDGKIEFNNFSMKYHQDLEYVLKNINLTINPGERIGIVGRTGAGKTSLARSLFQLVDKSICNGSILIDGHDTFSMNRRDVRAKLGIIPQDPTLFSGSYRQNLDPLVKYSVEDMWSAILKCGMDELVQPKHDRNKTQNEKIVAEGEHDNELKEIDRWNQKLLMRNRKIIVLDEATSSMDQESDQDMQKLIRSEFKDCTVLTIAHRLKTIMGSDRIVVLNNGRVVEVGPPSELLEKGGHFAELVKANEF
ncbi:hypothetical protein H4217_006398 [Coemansia sp. RSA 1939]|nr:hypothetical protein H4217_006398 [Coemansia sp. RSA 1939]